MEIDFEFKKERKLGEFVQDFIDLMKLVLLHFFQTLFKLAVFPLCFMLVLFYYFSTQISLTNAYSDFYSSFSLLFVLVILGFIVTLFFYGFAVEYFILLKNRKGTGFNAQDVWQAFRQHFKYYLKFMLAFLVVLVLISIPMLIATIILLVIPLIGGFAIGVLYAAFGVWVFSSFLFYREGYFELFDTFSKSLNLLKKKMVDYAVASYIVNFIFQALLGMLTFIPTLLLGIIAYNFVGFNDQFFDSFLGRLLLSFGGIVVTLLFMLYYMFSVLVHGIIYESAKELHFGESLYAKIDRLGEDKDG